MPHASSRRFVWEHPELMIDLPGDWRQESADATNSHLELVSDLNRARITISITPVQMPMDQLEEVARGLMALHRKYKCEARGYRLRNETITPRIEEQSVELSYDGQRSGVGTFGFVAFVSTRKIVTMCCDRRLSFEAGRASAMSTLAKGFKIRLP